MPEQIGWLLWLLIFGYMVAMAVYSFTFGRYAANAVGGGLVVARGFSIAVVVAFLAVNLRGIRLSSLTEDGIVATKLIVLGSIGKPAPRRGRKIIDLPSVAQVGLTA